MRKFIKASVCTAIIVSLCIILASCSGSYSKGTLSENSWSSEYIGLTFTAPEGCQLSPQDELDKMIVFDGEPEYKDNEYNYKKAASVCEMIAIVDSKNQTDLPNVVVNVKVVEDDTTEYDYLTSVAEKLVSLSSADITYESDLSIGTALLADISFSTVSVKAKSGDNTILQEYYALKKDDRMITVIFSYNSSTLTAKDTLVSSFSKYVEE